jgi:putative membrane protein
MTNAQHEKGRLDPDKIEAEILANERTFLAWVRTSIAVMSLGFVIARFSLWMGEMSSGANPAMRVRHTGVSVMLGE